MSRLNNSGRTVVATSRLRSRLRSGATLTGFVLLLILLAWIPLYRILIPPVADLSQQILVNKLLWEKLHGVSHLDLEVSGFLGYRLISLILVSLISLCRRLGISLVYLPKMAVMVLIALHAIVVGTLLYLEVRNRSLRSLALAFCFSVPAVVSMYSASWFIGFVGFTLGVTLLVAAVFLTERYLVSGSWINAVLLLPVLFLVYSAHPFAVVFWVLWCVSSALAVIGRRSFFLELKRIAILGITFLPILLYHLLATTGSGMVLSTTWLKTESPRVPLHEWYHARVLGLLSGAYLNADDTADSSVFALAAIGLILFSVFLAFKARRTADVSRTALSSILFIFIASWINERFIPVPSGHWLAYDLRFSTTVYVISLAVAGMVFIRTSAVFSTGFFYKLTYVLLAVIAVVTSVSHLLQVQKAYVRFDVSAREYLAKTFNHERPSSNALPRNHWNDPRALRLYVCLQQPDCNPAGTLFTKIGGDVYPVKLRSAARIMPADAPSVETTLEPVNAFKGAEGYGPGYFSRPRGIAADNSGNIYVADTGNARIQKFDSRGNFVFATGRYGQGSSEVREPAGIAVDSAGNIYVVDAANRKLLRFGPTGTFDKEWADPKIGFLEPRDIALGPTGQLYILDLSLGRVINFDPVSESFRVWSTNGTGGDRLVRPTGIACSGGFVFVAELGSDRIRVFDLGGRPIREIGVPAWGHYVWHYPDIAYDEQTRRLYVTNGWKKEVLVFDINGKFIGLQPYPVTEYDNLSSVVLSRSNGGRFLYLLNTGSEVYDLGEPSVLVVKLADN